MRKSDNVRKMRVADELSSPRATLSVAVGLSGGVDSAVSATLLKEQGHEVIGVHLYCWGEGDYSERSEEKGSARSAGSYCTADKDRASALKVAKHLDIPFIVWDLRKEYKKRVINYFFDEYRKGRTPNPDVMCNREIKFGIFFERAFGELKVGKIATGHYARLRREIPSPNFQFTDGGTSTNIERTEQEAGSKRQNSKLLAESHKPLAISYHLLRGVDEGKDQSYFLWVLNQKHLARTLFPVGAMLKSQVRAKAREWKLPCADRPDSQGICFVGPVNVTRFLREHLPTKPGPVIDTEGKVIGEHDGVWFYTEGQRRGFRVKKPSYPLYIIKKDLMTNTLVVGRGKESEVSEFEVEGVNWVNPKQEARSKKQEVGVRIRHLGEIMPATVESADSKPLAISHKLLAKLALPAFGVAPGQSAVFYRPAGRQGRGEEVLGGGVISSFT